MRTPWWALVLTLSILLVVPAAARSRGSHAAGREVRAAKQLLAEADAAMAKKDFAAARRALSELYRTTQQPEGLYRLGLLAYAEQQLLDAQDLLRRFLSDSNFDPAASVVEETEARRILALPRPASGKVSVIGERGALVYVDAKLRGALPLSRPLLVTPGKHTLTLEDGPRSQQEEVEVSVERFVEVTYDRSSSALLSAELSGVLLLEHYDGLPAEAPAQVTQALEDVLQSERLSSFPLALVLERAGIPQTSSCIETPACQAKIARQSELDYVLDLYLTQRPLGAPWRLRLSLLDTEVGEEAARSAQECPQCDTAKAIAVLRTALPALVTAARRRPRGELAVTSTPPGAEVRRAGRLLGMAPLVHAAWAGAFDVEVSLPGYEPRRLPVVLKENEKVALQAELQADIPESPPPPLAPPPPAVAYRYERAPVPKWRLAVGGVALGTGALLAGFGSSALAIAGDCVVDPLPPVQACRQFFGTRSVGTGLLVSGLATFVTGGILLVIPGPRRRVAAFPRIAARVGE